MILERDYFFFFLPPWLDRTTTRFRGEHERRSVAGKTSVAGKSSRKIIVPSSFVASQQWFSRKRAAVDERRLTQDEVAALLRARSMAKLPLPPPAPATISALVVYTVAVTVAVAANVAVVKHMLGDLRRSPSSCLVNEAL
jgi:hypothetical protein